MKNPETATVSGFLFICLVIVWSLLLFGRYFVCTNGRPGHGHAFLLIIKFPGYVPSESIFGAAADAFRFYMPARTEQIYGFASDIYLGTHEMERGNVIF